MCHDRLADGETLAASGAGEALGMEHTAFPLCVIPYNGLELELGLGLGLGSGVPSMGFRHALQVGASRAEAHSGQNGWPLT